MASSETYLLIGSTLRKILVARVVSSALPSSALASEAARIEPACLGTTGVEQGAAGGNGADGVDEVSKTSPARVCGNVPRAMAVHLVRWRRRMPRGDV